MAKTSSNTRQSLSASASSISDGAPAAATTPNRKLVLRIKSKHNSSKDEDKEWRTSSQKRPKLSSKNKVRSAQKKIDANKPKKPPTAFFYFLEDFRKVYQEENPEVKTMRDIGKACGEKLKTMTYEEKVKYYDIAAEKRAEFGRAMAEYIRRKESGEDAESEGSESEFDDL